MNRIHFFELEDLQWFPDVIRNTGTGFLHVIHKVADLDKMYVPKIVDLVRKSGVEKIVDLGSGAGGPIPGIVRKLKQSHGYNKIYAILTDFYPNADARAKFNASEFSEFVSYNTESIDAAHVPESLTGIRTMFLSFHHMPETIARGILNDAQKCGQPIAIFEALGRNLPSFFCMLLIGFVPFLFMPFVKPFRVLNLILTYIFPIVPLFFLFDGWVSFFRTYSPKELRALIASIPKNHNYIWEVGEVGWQRAPYLVGYQRQF